MDVSHERINSKDFVQLDSQPATQYLDDSIKMDETLMKEEKVWDQMNSIQCTFWDDCKNESMKLKKIEH